MDFGLLLEALGMMMAQVERQGGGNPYHIRTREEILAYAKNYLDKSGHDYDKNWSAKIPPSTP